MRTLSITASAELRQADHKAMIAWERFMRESEHAAASTICRRLAALSARYKHLVRHGHAAQITRSSTGQMQITREASHSGRSRLNGSDRSACPSRPWDCVVSVAKGLFGSTFALSLLTAGDGGQPLIGGSSPKPPPRLLEPDFLLGDLAASWPTVEAGQGRGRRVSTDDSWSVARPFLPVGRLQCAHGPSQPSR